MLCEFFLLLLSVVLISGQYEQHRTFVASQLERPWNTIFDNDYFGAKVAASSENLVVVSTKPSLNSFSEADEYDSISSFNQEMSKGRVYIFDTEVTVKKPTAVVENPQPYYDSGFGEDTIAITKNRLYIGDSKYNKVGCIYIYERFSNHNWTLTQTISTSDSSPYQFFGKHLDVTEDGSMLIVTASGGHSFMGVVSAYRLMNNTYILSQELTSDDKIEYTEDDDGYYRYQGDDDVYSYLEYGGAYHEFGRSVSLDKNQLAISQARNENLTACVKIYHLRDDKFYLRETFLSDYGENFGASVHIKDNVLLIQTSAPINGTGIVASVVNLYNRANHKESFKLQHQLSGNDLNHFGASLAIHNELLLIGAPYESSGAV